MSAGTGIERSTVLEAIQGSWPVLQRERNWTTWGLVGVALSAGVAAWSYMIGGAVAYYLDARMGTAAMIAGSLVGMLLVTLATVPVSVKYGIDTIASSKPQFGSRGALFSIFLQYTSIIGWNCLLLILLGRAIAEVLASTQVIPAGMQPGVAVLASVAAVAVSWVLLRGGAQALRSYSYIIAIVVSVIALWILFRLLTQFGLAQVFSAQPLASSGDRLWDYTAGFEILVASVLSWWPYMGGIVRMVPTARQAAWPSMLCMGLPTGVISLIGLYSALVTGEADPTKWLIQIGGLTFGILALLFLALANVGTAIVGAYTTAIGLRQIAFFQRRLTWNQTTFVILFPVALIAALIPGLFFERIGTFLAFLGVCFAPVVGIQVTDYFLLRRKHIEVTALYDDSARSPYHFWGGVNPAGMIALGVGFVTYVLLLNPVTYASGSLFRLISASVPAVVTSGLSYYLVTRLLVMPARKGGYGSQAAKEN